MSLPLAAGRVAAEIVGRALGEGAAAQSAATRELREVTSQTREAREQRRWLATAATLGVMGGVLLWFMLIVLLPGGIGTWLAALPLAGGDRWAAGQQLMRAADPAGFSKIVQLSQACGDQPAALCAAAIAVQTAGSAEQEGTTRAGAAPARPRQEPRP